MAWTPPTKHLKKKELLNAKAFYRKLSQKFNYVDESTAHVWYIGLAHLVIEELEKHGFVRLPCIGDMALVTQKARVGWAGTRQVKLDPKEVLRFYPKTRLKKYLNGARKR